MLVLATSLSACAFFGAEHGTAELDSAVARSDRVLRESKTVSSLAAIEKSLDDYVQHEGKIPARLDVLIPKYAAEIPLADPAVSRHAASNDVTYYPSNVIRDGVVDGTRIKDSDGWGYAANDRQIIIFVNCTHTNSHNRPWYREPGTLQWSR
ncbi:MAG: hypothetical protein NTX64_15960 [Elusimicrobia bacterium]|nr:hypothetical protein [Elusimicrobiota bacterium]